jgi:hypothetical protein
MLKNWLLCHGVQSEGLCKVMTMWVDWLSNSSPPYAAYRAVNTVCTIALNKTPGVCLLGIGKCWMRLWSDCSHTKTKVEATNACGNTKHCAGLPGIEANLHAVCAIWLQSAGWTKDLGKEEDKGDPEAADTSRQGSHAKGMLDLLVGLGAAEDDSQLCYVESTGFGSALFDARNGFNKLNQYLMLWNVAHLWNCMSRFAFNHYCHWVCCLVQTELGEPSIVIHSKEGITQGDCLAMSLYRGALMPLAFRMLEKIPEALQRWCCNDAGMAGMALPHACCLDFLVEFGPQYGYFPKLSKLYYI